MWEDMVFAPTHPVFQVPSCLLNRHAGHGQQKAQTIHTEIARSLMLPIAVIYQTQKYQIRNTNIDFFPIYFPTVHCLLLYGSSAASNKHLI